MSSKKNTNRKVRCNFFNWCWDLLHSFFEWSDPAPMNFIISCYLHFDKGLKCYLKVSIFKLYSMAIFKPSSSSTFFKCFFFHLYFLQLRVTTIFKNLRSFNSKKEIYSIKSKIYPKITTATATTTKLSRNVDIKINLVYYYSKE